MLAVVHVLGSMLMLFSVTYLLPVVTSLIYRDGLAIDFVIAALASLAAGALLHATTRRCIGKSPRLSAKPIGRPK
jgi:trk system potassium uptake protein TrkH